MKEYLTDAANEVTCMLLYQEEDILFINDLGKR